MTPPPGASVWSGASHDAAIEHPVPTSEAAWEQVPVAVLALELMWSDVSGSTSLRTDPWTEQARWEEAILDKVCGFGGVLVERAASRLVWVFGVPRMLEQLPQRAVHSALAIRQMVAEVSGPDFPPCPAVRLAAHLGPVRVDRRAADPAAQVLAVGETLALPVRLLEEAASGEVVVSPEVGRLVDGWVALQAQQSRAADPARLDACTVLGVSAGRETWAGRRRPTRSPFVGR
jgi:hypothetical protein